MRWGQGGLHRLLDAEQLREAFRVEVTRRVDKTGQVRWQGQRWIVPEGLLQTSVQLRVAPQASDTIEVWADGQYYGVAVRIEPGVLPVAPMGPAPAALPPTGLSYLDVLADRQRASRPPGLRYHDPAVSPHSVPKEEDLS